jgi:hypothetical protein
MLPDSLCYVTVHYIIRLGSAGLQLRVPGAAMCASWQQQQEQQQQLAGGLLLLRLLPH